MSKKVTMSVIGLIVSSLVNAQDTSQSHNHMHEIERIRVTGSPMALKVEETAIAASILSGKSKLWHHSLSLGDSIAHMAGVDTVSTGGQAGKPVIRGSTGNRVRVLQDSVPQDFQQFGIRHAPTVDPVNAHRIDVVRGPMSVIFGSDAIGGVVNVISAQVPMYSESLLSSALLSFKYGTNNEQLGTSLHVEGGKAQWGWASSYHREKADNFETPSADVNSMSVSNLPRFSGEIPFTNFDIESISLASGFVSDAFDWTLRYTGFSNEQNFLQPNNVPTGQHLDNKNVLSDIALHLSDQWNVHFILNWQKNERTAGTGISFEKLSNANSDLDIELERTQSKLVFEHDYSTAWKGQFGAEYIYKDQTTNVGTLVPDASVDYIALYAYEKFENDFLIAELGGRWDKIALKPQNESQQWVDNFDRRVWRALTGSMSLSWKLSDNWLFIQRIGRGFRAPSIFDLYAGGVHGGVAAYQTSNSELVEEYSFNKEVGLNYISQNIQASITFYQNTFQDYIYQADTGTTHQPSGLPLFEMRQGDAQIEGVEIGANFKITQDIDWEFNANVINSELDSVGSELPLMPANSFYQRINYSFGELSSFSDINFVIEHEYKNNKSIAGKFEPFAQYDFLPFGTASTEQYHLINLGASAQLQINKHPVTLSVKVNNVTDEAYRDFLDTYKGYALGMGRNIQLSLSAQLR